jgi:orotidine-5'-phosphate decarboxylase
MTDLIVALDVENYSEAMGFVYDLNQTAHERQGAPPLVKWFKVGLELFIANGDRVVPELKRRGLNVMLDLKLHDIPETVSRATMRAIDLGADMLTIHAQGGPAMIEAAVKAADGEAKILAVTVLTSLNEADLVRTGHSPTPHKTLVSDLAFQLFRMASDSGADGVVCSALEVEMLKMNISRPFLFVTPGVRLADGVVGDQKRVATPAYARAAGANFVVMGRPIRDAQDRIGTVNRVLAELQP